MKLRYLVIPLTRVPEPYRSRIEISVSVVCGLCTGAGIGMTAGLIRFMSELFG